MKQSEREKDWLLTEETNSSESGSKLNMIMNISPKQNLIQLKSHQLLLNKRLLRRRQLPLKKKTRLN